MHVPSVGQTDRWMDKKKAICLNSHVFFLKNWGHKIFWIKYGNALFYSILAGVSETTGLKKDRIAWNCVLVLGWPALQLRVSN